MIKESGITPQIEMAKDRINIKEFSSKIGVSTATVSRAFGTKGRISDETREHILQKASELGYRANANARNLILQKTDSVGFFYPSLIKGEPDYFIAEIMLGINETLLSNGMRLQVYPFSVSGEDITDDYKNMIWDGTLDGVIILGGTPEGDSLVRIANDAKIPNIVISDIEEERKGYVGFNTEAGSEKAGKYFLDNKRKQPAFVCGLQDARKLRGFMKGLGPLADKIEVDYGGTRFIDGYNAYERLMKSNSKVDCVFCANDIIAIGFMKAAIENGVSIPEDISVIGCDDIRFAKFHSPSLTTIRIPKYVLGEESVKNLMKIIGNKQKSKPAEMLECKLIVRQSS